MDAQEQKIHELGCEVQRLREAVRIILTRTTPFGGRGAGCLPDAFRKEALNLIGDAPTLNEETQG